MQHKFIELLKHSLGDAKPLNKAIAAFSAPKERNSLYSFFTNATHDSVSIEYVYNHVADRLKHPGGTSSGENCLILDSQYHIFTPLNPSNGLTRSEVVQRLLDSFNAPPDFNDAEVINLYYDYSDFLRIVLALP